MTVGELREIIEPFTDGCKVISETGEDLTFRYMLDDDGEGYVVLMGRRSLCKGY